MSKFKSSSLLVFATLLVACGKTPVSSSVTSSSTSATTSTPTSVTTSDDHVIPSSEVTPMEKYEDPNAAAYYASIANLDTLTGAALADALRTRGRQNFTGVNYDTATTHIKTMDRIVKEGQNYVLGIYSRNLIPEDQRQTNPYSPAQQVNFWNKEHVFPQSKLADGNDALKADNSKVNLSSDIANLFAEDSKVNEGKSNYSFADIDEGIHNYLIDSMGNKTDMQFTKFVEPTDLAKGEVARANLYMILMYPDNCAINENGNIALFLKWNREFPPTRERDLIRNQTIFSVQKNRNPFIDDVDFACEIWGDTNTLTRRNCA